MKGLIKVLLIMTLAIFIVGVYSMGYENGQKNEQEFTNHYKELAEKYKNRFEIELNKQMK